MDREFDERMFGKNYYDSIVINKNKMVKNKFKMAKAKSSEHSNASRNSSLSEPIDDDDTAKRAIEYQFDQVLEKIASIDNADTLIIEDSKSYRYMDSCFDEVTPAEVKAKFIDSLSEYIKTLTLQDSSIDKSVLNDTPARFADALQEMCSGYAVSLKGSFLLFLKKDALCNENKPQTPEESFKGLFENENKDKLNPILVDDIHFSTICEHHLLPFFGTVSICYIPKDHILGLSKFSRIVDHFSKRLQLQERLTHQIADSILEITKCHYVLVRISAKYFFCLFSRHCCVSCRGVFQPENNTLTLATAGDKEGTDKEAIDKAYALFSLAKNASNYVD